MWWFSTVLWSSVKFQLNQKVMNLSEETFLTQNQKNYFTSLKAEKTVNTLLFINKSVNGWMTISTQCGINRRQKFIIPPKCLKIFIFIGIFESFIFFIYLIQERNNSHIALAESAFYRTKRQICETFQFPRVKC